MTRLELAKAVMMGETEPRTSLDRWQRPLFYFPGLSTQSFYDARSFPWVNDLVAAYHDISGELRACLAARRGFESAFPKYAASGRWATCWLSLYGTEYEDNCRAFKKTLKAIASVPGLAGWIALSALEPGSHVRPHCGVTNAKLRLHYAIDAEPGSRLRVGSDYYEWTSGEIMIFDDSYEHEVWVGGSRPRIVLIVDFYHPELTNEEIALMRRFEVEPSALLHGQSLRTLYQAASQREDPGQGADWVYGPDVTSNGVGVPLHTWRD